MDVYQTFPMFCQSTHSAFYAEGSHSRIISNFFPFYSNINQTWYQTTCLYLVPDSSIRPPREAVEDFYRVWKSQDT